jgi:hypothetical protein
MAKLTLSDIDNESVPSASTTVNANSALIEAAIENTLSRAGTGPNSMGANLDMNSNRILNHAAARASSDTDLIRVGDLAALVALLGVQGPAGPTGDGTGDMLAENNLSDVADVATSQQNLDLEPGVDVLAYDGDIQAIADLTWTANGSLIWRNGSGTIAVLDLSSIVETLIQANDAASFRSDLGLGGAAVLSVGTGSGTVCAGDDSRFKQLPINTVNASGNLLLSYGGSMVRHTSASAHTFTVPNTSSINHPVGTVIQVRNAVSGGAVTLARAAGVSLRLAGSTTDANLTLAEAGLCSLVHESANVWVASGVGLS